MKRKALLCIILLCLAIPAQAILSTQQILNKLYDSGELLSVQQIFNAVYDQGWRPAGGTIVAKSGGDYSTIGAGILAAAQSASESAPRVVIVYPGTYTENVSVPAWVAVVAIADGAVAINGDLTVAANGRVGGISVSGTTSSLGTIQKPYQPVANILTVAESGADYTTVQAAVDAAAAVAADANRVTVLVYPGVKRDYTAVDNVDVVFIEDEANAGALTGPYSRNLMPIPNQMPSPYAGGLICLIIDDGGNGVMTAGAGGCAAGVTPAQYARDNGVPITQAIIPGTIGLAGYLTAANLRQLVYEYGHELCNHSGIHNGPTPSTQAGLVDAIDDAKQDIEAFADAAKRWTGASAVNTIGAPVRGFVYPGPWDGDGAIDSTAKAENWVHRYVRSRYEWSFSEIGELYPLVYPNIRHGSSRYSPTSTYNAARLTQEASSPDARVCVFMHATSGSPLPTTAGYSFKALIDAIVAARASGLLQAVTASAFFDFAPGSSRDADRMYAIDNMTDVSNGWRYGFNFHASGTSTIALDTGEVASGKCLELAHGGANYWENECEVTKYQRVMPGYTYRLRFALKRNTADGGDVADTFPLKVMFYSDGAQAVTGTNYHDYVRDFTIGTLDDWVTFDHTFTVPSWCVRVGLVWGGYLYAPTSGTPGASGPSNSGETWYLDEIRPLMRT